MRRVLTFLGSLSLIVAWFHWPTPPEILDQATTPRNAAHLELISWPTTRYGPYSDPTQVFEVGRGGYLSRIDVMVHRGDPVDAEIAVPLVMELRRVGRAGHPSSSTLARASVPVDRIPEHREYVPFRFDDSPLRVHPNDRLAITLTAESTDLLYNWCQAYNDPYPGGSSFLMESYPRFRGWCRYGSADFVFRTFVTPVEALRMPAEPDERDRPTGV